MRPEDIIDNARACGLQVHTWTIGQKEYFDLFDLDVDGVLIDFAHTGVKACDAWFRGFESSSLKTLEKANLALVMPK